MGVENRTKFVVIVCVSSVLGKFCVDDWSSHRSKVLSRSQNEMLSRIFSQTSWKPKNKERNYAQTTIQKFQSKQVGYSTRQAKHASTGIRTWCLQPRLSDVRPCAYRPNHLINQCLV